MALSFAGNGVITGLSVGGLPDGTVDADTLASGVGGKVLQCLQAVQTAVVTTTSTSLVDVTGLTQAITPSATSSKILIYAHVASSSNDSGNVFQLVRDSTSIFQGDAGDSSETQGSFAVYGAAGNTHDINLASACFLDSPSSTSSITYRLQWKCLSGSTNYLNRNRRDSGSSDTRLASSITVMEISA